jgi:hypothetical protein
MEVQANAKSSLVMELALTTSRMNFVDTALTRRKSVGFDIDIAKQVAVKHGIRVNDCDDGSSKPSWWL